MYSFIEHVNKEIRKEITAHLADWMFFEKTGLHLPYFKPQKLMVEAIGTKNRDYAESLGYQVKENACVGSYPVSGYTREDGTEVSGYVRQCGAAHNNNSSSEIQVQKEQENSVSVNNKSKFIRPLEGKITSEFGYRVAPTKGASTGHSGIDIGVPIGTPVKVIADGTVIAAQNGMRGYGIAVFVDHGIIDGKRVVSEYGHLNQYNVKVGDKVKQGQSIAKSGNTGISTGPHLHLTIREDGTPINPKKYLSDY